MIPSKKYSFSIPNEEGEIIFGYDSDGWLVEFSVQGNLPPTIYNYITSKAFPYQEAILKHLVAISKTGATIKLIPNNLEFETFWNAYDYKVDKKTTERRWAKMSNANKLAAINYISSYENQLLRTGLAKKYPSTYLSKEPWNDGK